MSFDPKNHVWEGVFASAGVYVEELSTESLGPTHRLRRTSQFVFRRRR
jgi:hypothetical protein